MATSTSSSGTNYTSSSSSSTYSDDDDATTTTRAKKINFVLFRLRSAMWVEHTNVISPTLLRTFADAVERCNELYYWKSYRNTDMRSLQHFKEPRAIFEVATKAMETKENSDV